jgi:hypothetical protein
MLGAGDAEGNPARRAVQVKPRQGRQKLAGPPAVAGLNRPPLSQGSPQLELWVSASDEQLCDAAVPANRMTLREGPQAVAVTRRYTENICGTL